MLAAKPQPTNGDGASHFVDTASIADVQDVPSVETNGTVRLSERELDADIPSGVRAEYTKRMVMYGSTQTHSLGAKVRKPNGNHEES